MMESTREPIEGRRHGPGAHHSGPTAARAVPPIADASAWDTRLPAVLVRLGLALSGAGLIAIGLLFDGDALTQLVARNLAPDGELSARTASQVASLHPLFFAIGIILLGLAIAGEWAIAIYRGLETVLIAVVRFILRLLVVAVRALGTAATLLPSAVPVRAREPILLALLLGLVVSLSLWARAAQPPFHAEGINLQPAKNLVLHGKYALRSYEGFDGDTFRITTGPAMLVPTAVAFALLGVRFAVANAVAIAFFVAFLLLAYAAMRRQLGGGAVLLGLFFFVLHPANIFFGASCGYVDGGMGESPGLAYMMIGVLLWSAALARPSNLRLLVAGLFFGLSFQSKWLFLFTIFAAVGAYGVLRLTGRRLPSRVYLLPLIGLLVASGAFFLMRVSQFGLQGEMAHLSRLLGQHLRRAVGFSTGEGQVESIFAVARPLVTLAQVDFWSILGFFLTAPGIAYAIVLLRRRLDPLLLYILVFTLMWFVWWLVFSYDLPLQHILYIMPFMQIFAAKLLVDGWHAAHRWRATGPTVALRASLLAVIALVVLGKTAVPLLQHVDEIHRGAQELAAPYRDFVTHVEANTEPDAVFSGWSWSKPWWLSISQDRTIKDRARYPFEQRENHPEYLVVTPEWPLDKTGTGWPDMAYRSQWTYRQNERRLDFIRDHCTHLLTTGGEHTWHLYRVNPLPGAAEQAPREGNGTGGMERGGTS